MAIRSARLALAGVLLLLQLPLASAAQPLDKFGGTFGELRPEQQLLVRRWMADYGSLVKRKLDAEKVYNELPLSARTTFQAVTHALLSTPLTTASGKSMGTALDLIDIVERVAGQVPGARGDRQFRIYVYLKRDAVSKLYASREFRRTHDNTVYHIGYPINFRQQGGVPSAQISVARTGRRADIDVDYRSSAGVSALVSGHLTSANSDVRAGQNVMTHNRRWDGLSNWWKDLMAAFLDRPALNESVVGFASGAERERRRIARGPIHEAVYAYLKDWLVEQEPEELLPLISIKAYPCVAEFGGDSHPDSKLALSRILRQMMERNRSLGRVERLEDVVHAVSYRLPDSLPVQHPYGKLFSLQEVPDDVAWAIDCRIRYRLQMAESVPRPPHRLNRTFVVSMRVKNPKEPRAFLVQTWQQEAGEWRLVSFDIKRNTMTPPENLLESVEQLPPAGSPAAQIAKQAEDLFDTLLLKKNVSESMKFFLPESYACDAYSDPSPAQGSMHAAAGTADAKRLSGFLEELVRQSLPGDKLEAVMAAVEAGHPDLKLLIHRRESAFFLAEVTGELQGMSQCGAAEPSQRTRAAAAARPGSMMATAFRLIQPQGEESAVVTLYWKMSEGRWRVASYSVATD